VPAWMMGASMDVAGIAKDCKGWLLRTGRG
jgi:hypothetical protein